MSLILCVNSALAQTWLMPLNHHLNFVDPDSGFGAHTSFKPYRASDLLEQGQRSKVDILGGKTLYSSSSSSGLRIRPIADMMTGIGSDSSQYYFNGVVGVGILGEVSDKISLFLQGSWARFTPPDYLIDWRKSFNVIPGFGLSNVGKGALVWEGNLSYSPNRIFNFQIGQGKHFIGDGYRSLLRSDNGAPNPYALITTKIWRFKYMNLYTQQQSVYGSRVERDKYTASHYLSCNVGKYVSLGFFESIIWQARDTLLNRGVEWNYINPVIFYRPVEYLQGSADNAIMGLNVKVAPWEGMVWYGQFILDEFLLKEIRARSGWWANKYGVQTGIKLVDPIGIDGFRVRTEFNFVRPFTYSHGTSIQNYGHQNQPLAHPIGANFWEWVNQVFYERGRWRFSEQLNVSAFGEDQNGLNYGGNIFASYANRVNDYGNTIAQGRKRTVYFNRVQVDYLLVKEFNLSLSVNYTFRHSESQSPSTLHLFQIGVRTNFSNQYLDF